MSITLNVDTYLLCSMFNISAQKLSTVYSGKTIDEIMEIEAENGNTAAAQFDASVLNDPVKLLELFELKDPNNKFAILSNMNEQDLEELLPLLTQDNLIEGLNYFTKDKILDMVEEIPGEQLVNFTLQMFSPEQIMQFMPEKQLNKILTSTNLEKSTLINHLDSLKPEILAQMVEAATGQPAQTNREVSLSGKGNFDGKALKEQIINLPDDQFQEAILGIPPATKQDFILGLVQENPDLYLEMDADAFTNIINNRKEKEDLIKSATVIEHEQLVKMMEQLPKDLTAVVLTQMDSQDFAEILTSQYKDILKEIIAG